jgi:peptidoglycan/LPS O-acetylase OafA/YrhL
MHAAVALARRAPPASSVDEPYAVIADRARGGSASQEQFSIAVGYLRTFVTLLVVAHHAVLAYHQFAPGAPASLAAEPRWWQVFPVVDSHRWAGFTLLVAFNDMFFMSLMFFLSGLFVWSSLRRKGSVTFLRDRSLRLGLPFIVSAAVLAPLAYYPSYLSASSTPGVIDFWRQWLSLGTWPSGPAWFIWVLLGFNVVAAVLFTLNSRWADVLGRRVSRVVSPAASFAILVVASAAAYIPMVIAFGPLEWTTIGPFSVQTSRVLHYAVYFVAGVLIGASGAEHGLLAPNGRLAQRWLLWAGAALVFFVVALGIVTVAMTQPDRPYLWGSIGGLAFSLSCAASCFGLLAILLRRAHRRVGAFESLRDNAYGIYLVHYAVVTWLQYALLGAALPGLIKGILVFLGSVAVSWSVAAAVRRIPAVARVV